MNKQYEIYWCCNCCKRTLHERKYNDNIAICTKCGGETCLVDLFNVCRETKIKDIETDHLAFQYKMIRY